MKKLNLSLNTLAPNHPGGGGEGVVLHFPPEVRQIRCTVSFHVLINRWVVSITLLLLSYFKAYQLQPRLVDDFAANRTSLSSTVKMF